MDRFNASRSCCRKCEIASDDFSGTLDDWVVLSGAWSITSGAARCTSSGVIRQGRRADPSELVRILARATSATSSVTIHAIANDDATVAVSGRLVFGDGGSTCGYLEIAIDGTTVRSMPVDVAANTAWATVEMCYDADDHLLLRVVGLNDEGGLVVRRSLSYPLSGRTGARVLIEASVVSGNVEIDDFAWFRAEDQAGTDCNDCDPCTSNYRFITDWDFSRDHLGQSPVSCEFDVTTGTSGEPLSIQADPALSPWDRETGYRVDVDVEDAWWHHPMTAEEVITLELEGGEHTVELFGKFIGDYLVDSYVGLRLKRGGATIATKRVEIPYSMWSDVQHRDADRLVASLQDDRFTASVLNGPAQLLTLQATTVATHTDGHAKIAMPQNSHNEGIQDLDILRCSPAVACQRCSAITDPLIVANQTQQWSIDYPSMEFDKGIASPNPTYSADVATLAWLADCSWWMSEHDWQSPLMPAEERYLIATINKSGSLVELAVTLRLSVDPFGNHDWVTFKRDISADDPIDCGDFSYELTYDSSSSPIVGPAPTVTLASV